MRASFIEGMGGTCRVTREAERLTGGRFISSGLGGSVARASDASESMIKLTCAER